MKNKKDLQELIIKKEGLIFSEGTLNLTHLLSAVYDLIVEFNLDSNLEKDIEKVFTNTDPEDDEKNLPTYHNQYYGYIEIPKDKEEEASYIFNEDIFDLFNDIAPEGFYFGNLEGDGACFGWFVVEDEE